MTIAKTIYDFLSISRDWEWGGKIEDHIRAKHGTKSSSVARVCRDMVSEGMIEVRMQPIIGGNKKFVQYRRGPARLIGGPLPPAFKPQAKQNDPGPTLL